jgi:hypothetical protein
LSRGSNPRPHKRNLPVHDHIHSTNKKSKSKPKNPYPKQKPSPNQNLLAQQPKTNFLLQNPEWKQQAGNMNLSKCNKPNKQNQQTGLL